MINLITNYSRPSSKKAIGIISYLPDDPTIRALRFGKLRRLIYRCGLLFDLPMIIIAQNWTVQDIQLIGTTDFALQIRAYKKLGITGARRQLRNVFLALGYDYLIMLDDDCEIEGKSGIEYIKQIDDHPDCFLEFRGTQLKLFAISRSILLEEDYDPNINAEDGTGFEDRIFVENLRDKYPSKRVLFTDTGLEMHSKATKDELSTWCAEDQDITVMRDKTRAMIAEHKYRKKEDC